MEHSCIKGCRFPIQSYTKILIRWYLFSFFILEDGVGEGEEVSRPSRGRSAFMGLSVFDREMNTCIWSHAYMK